MRLTDVKEKIKEIMKDNLDEAKHHQYPNSVFYTSENDGLKKALDIIEKYENEKEFVTDVDYSSRKTKGCDTCDYGADYISDMYITYDKRYKVIFHSMTKYEEDSISESDWIIAILNANNHQELIDWYISKMVPVVKEDYKWKYPWTKQSDIYYEIEDLAEEGVEIKRHYIGVDD